MPVFGSSDAYKDDYDWDGMLGAARLLSHAQLDVICWNGSKGASLGFDADSDAVRAHHRRDRHRGDDLDPRARSRCCARPA